MTDPSQIPRGDDPIPSNECVDAKRLRCSATPADPVSKVLVDNNASSWPQPVPPLDDENLLQEILLRLPIQPSSLPRASLVHQRWHNILSDPGFLTRFRKHHRSPPLLGFFEGKPFSDHVFTSILEPPNRIPDTHFTLPYSLNGVWYFMGCRHGLAVLFEGLRCETLLWDPLTGQKHRVASPPVMNLDEGESWQAATVLCANTEDGHVHGDCFSSPFKLILVGYGHMQAFACLYESLSGVWRNVVSTATTTHPHPWLYRPSILLGNALFWLIREGHILAFDLERQSLGVIEKPTDLHDNYDGDDCCFQLLRMENGGLGLAVLSELTVQLWERSICDGVVGWVLQKTILLDELLPRGVHSDDEPVCFVGYDEDANMIVLSTKIGNFTLQFNSMLIRHIINRNEMCYNRFYPYRNFYTAGRRVKWNWLDMDLEL